MKANTCYRAHVETSRNKPPPQTKPNPTKQGFKSLHDSNLRIKNLHTLLIYNFAGGVRDLQIISSKELRFP